MNLQRRDFSTCLAAGAGFGALLIGLPVCAQSAPVEGVNYIRLAQPLPISVPGKIEVIEFFWYGCPHCNAFEPALEPWTQQLPADVAFRRVPVWFREEPFTAHQKIYFALESLDLLPTMHRRVFFAIHSERQSLSRPDDIAAFMTRNGVDGQKFMAAYNSFSVQTKVQQARSLAAGYKIDAVPAMGVQGRFYTTGSLANTNAGATSPGGSNERMLVVVDALVDKLRKGG